MHNNADMVFGHGLRDRLLFWLTINFLTDERKYQIECTAGWAEHCEFS